MSQRNPTYRYDDDEYVTDGEPSRPPTSQRRYQPQRSQQPQTGNAPRRVRHGDEDTSDYTEYLPASQNQYADEYEETRRSRYNPETQRLPIQRASRPAPNTAPRERVTDEYPAVQQRQPQQRVRGSQQQRQAQPKQERHDRHTTGNMQRAYDPRQRTTEDFDELDEPVEPVTNRPAVSPQVSRRSFFKDVAKTVLIGALPIYGAARGVGAGVQAVGYKVEQLEDQFQRGSLAHAFGSVVCGHKDSHGQKDSTAHPTLLQVVLFPDGVIEFEEYPAGNRNQTIPSVKASIRSFYAGDLHDVDLEIHPEEVAGGKFRIRVHVKIYLFTQEPFGEDFFWVDKGKGYFEPLYKQ